MTRGQPSRCEAWSSRRWTPGLRLGNPTSPPEARQAAVHDDVDLVVPTYSQRHDWKLELAVIIGTRAFRAPVKRAMDHTPPSCLTFGATFLGVADTITFRPDEDAQRALDALTADGTAISTAVRSALIDAARVRAEQRLRAEAETLALDPQDRAEAAQVLRDMETLRAW